MVGPAEVAEVAEADAVAGAIAVLPVDRESAAHTWSVKLSALAPRQSFNKGARASGVVRMESIFGTAALVATEAGELIKVIVEVIVNFRVKNWPRL
ncbi:hypothetical protein [Nitrosospira sp. Nsp1]|uniref:hypothetical protein n=1 Tax=Nitrosospira sp. Nsp1 TaxID=136547 RepID=UPI000881E39B|nr:hypothetical protein [Nitrosospira sp. Nsp1]SCX54444.1 hypothetical protein SAMN05720354_11445 [Nitrosospira sp. Nsp1]